MKQIVNNFRTGNLKLVDVPAPACQDGGIIIQNICSLVSIGTEKMILDLAKKSLASKAKERPDQVQQVIQKVKKRFGVDISGCYDEPIFKVLDHIESQINTTDDNAPDDYHHA